MIQKILKVGTSAAVTIPKKSLAELGLQIGDSITVVTNKAHRRVTIEPATTVNPEIVSWTKNFIEQYRSTLEALTKK